MFRNALKIVTGATAFVGLCICLYGKHIDDAGKYGGGMMLAIIMGLLCALLFVKRAI